MEKTVTRVLWATTASALPAIINEANPEKLLDMCYQTRTDLDMTYEGWTRVGIVECTVQLQPTITVYSAALAACDMRIQEIHENYMRKMNALMDIRQTLLALPQGNEK